MHDDQLSLDYDHSFIHAEDFEAILEHLARIAAHIQHKNVCCDLKLTKSQLSNALHQRDRHNPLLRWLPYFLRRDPTSGLMQCLGDIGGHDVTPRLKLNDAQKFKRLEAALAEYPPAIRDGLYRDAGLKR